MRSEIIVPPVTTNQKTAAIFIFHSHVMYARIVSHSPSYHARTVTSHHVDTLQSHIGRGFGTTLTPTVSSISVACSNSSHPFQNTIDLNWAVPWYLVHLHLLVHTPSKLASTKYRHWTLNMVLVPFFLVGRFSEGGGITVILGTRKRERNLKTEKHNCRPSYNIIHTTSRRGFQSFLTSRKWSSNCSILQLKRLILLNNTTRLQYCSLLIPQHPIWNHIQYSVRRTCPYPLNPTGAILFAPP